MPTVLITGGSGLIGTALTKSLVERNYQVIILSRTPENRVAVSPSIRYAGWNIPSGSIDQDAIAQADYIIHLAGAGIAGKRWTKKRKQEIVDSRVNGSILLVESLKKVPNKVKAVIASSAIGWYGSDPVIPNPKPFTEDQDAFNDFLGNTCRLWEQSLIPLTARGARLVRLRTGILLSRDGGILPRLEKPLRYRIAAVLGNGKQVMSWIHLQDLVNIFITAIENEKMEGVFNAVAPAPVSNRELTIQLARSEKRSFLTIHVPPFILKLLFGEMSIEILKSATVSAVKIRESGFVFEYNDIKTAIGKVVR